MRKSLKSKGPLSVVLPDDLRSRLDAQARKRELKLSTAVRQFLTEHLSELENDEQLSRAERWQRAEVWATWERMKAGDLREVTWEQLQARAAQAHARAEKARRK